MELAAIVRREPRKWIFNILLKMQKKKLCVGNRTRHLLVQRPKLYHLTTQPCMMIWWLIILVLDNKFIFLNLLTILFYKKIFDQWYNILKTWNFFSFITSHNYCGVLQSNAKNIKSGRIENIEWILSRYNGIFHGQASLWSNIVLVFETDQDEYCKIRRKTMNIFSLSSADQEKSFDEL